MSENERAAVKFAAQDLPAVPEDRSGRLRAVGVVLVAVLLLCWLLICWWQWQEYRQEIQLLRGNLVAEADVLTTAIVGGIRYHRRMGPYFREQLEANLAGIVAVKDVIGVALLELDGKQIMGVGETSWLQELSIRGQIDEGTHWTSGSLLFLKRFSLPPADRPVFGRGRGPRWQVDLESTEDDPLRAGGEFLICLALSSAGLNRQIKHAATRQAGLAVGTTLLLLLAGLLVFGFTRLAETTRKLRVVQERTAHLRDLAQTATGLAHEIRNPLAVVRGWVQRLSEAGNMLPDQRAMCSKILEECDRIASRIDRFANYARPLEPQVSRVDLHRLVAELRELLESDLQNKQLKLQANLPETCQVLADADMLRQALFNLLINAVAFSPCGQTIELLAFEKPRQTMRIEVRDRGPGVAEENIDRLFVPYFTTRNDGTGLGLAVVKRLADAHGWQVGYCARPEGGAIFWIDRIVMT